MTLLGRVRDFLRAWLDAIAAVVLALVQAAAGARAMRLIEDADGQFVMANDRRGRDLRRGTRIEIEDGKVTGAASAAAKAQLRGRRVELVLRPQHFLFKPLELPSRAAEFLEGVVRSQIDRLSPWTVDRAAFGWSSPIPIDSDRIVVTVAATAKDTLAERITALADLGVRSIKVSTRPSDGPADSPGIVVLEQNLAGALDIRSVRRILAVLLFAACFFAVGAAVAATFVSSSLQERQDALARRIAERRSAILAARNTAVDPTAAAEAALSRRKHQTPAAVIVLEVLSRILPDHTYVTELRIDGDKLRLMGLTHDAPGLIRLMEQSQHFTSATFFAPTTRAPTDNGDRFNIEARIVPRFSARP